MDENNRTDGGIVKRVEVQFQTYQYPAGEPFITLKFMKDGARSPMQGKLFAFDLTPDTSALEAHTIAHALNRMITHFVMTDVSSPENSFGTASPASAADPVGKERA